MIRGSETVLNALSFYSGGLKRTRTVQEDAGQLFNQCIGLGLHFG